MSVVESRSFTVAIDYLRQEFHRTNSYSSPSKRKAAEFLPSFIPGDGLFSTKMTKRSSSVGKDNLSSGSSFLQFFVRYSGQTIVMRAFPEDNVEVVHYRIWRLTGIPITEQRFILNGRQLLGNNTLAQCGVQKDSCLQLTGRLRSTERPGSWMVVGDIISVVSSIMSEGKFSNSSQRDDPKSCVLIDFFVRIFLEMTPRNDLELAKDHMNVFVSSGVPAGLVMIYVSGGVGARGRLPAENAIRLFLSVMSGNLHGDIHVVCFPVVLEFSKLLFLGVGEKDKLYIACRKVLSCFLQSNDLSESPYFDCRQPQVYILDVLPFVRELSVTLSGNLSKWILEEFCADNLSLVQEPLEELSNFLCPLQHEWDKIGSFPIPPSAGSSQLLDGDWFGSFHAIFVELLGVVDSCLMEITNLSKNSKEETLDEIKWSVLTVLLTLLTRLNDLSKIFEGAEEILHTVLLKHRVPLNILFRRAKYVHNLWWVLKYRDISDFESRKHLVLLMFPDDKDNYDEGQEMLIDRPSVLSESFQYIISADPLSLKGRLFMEFKNEEATGPGVVREWFCLLRREIFNQNNVLFLTCLNDRKRFFPNPASVVDPLHKDYFVFCGRFVALALRHRVQLGITFERTFFLNLSGTGVSLEDVQDTDPILYNSCKKILEMDEELLDSDILGLTFVRDVEHMGFRKTIELCDGGKDLVVNSRNRQKYVNLMVHHCFVASISKLVKHFLQGFSDILLDDTFGQRFFRSLDLEDLDCMLGGSNGNICTMDWKKHTEYKGYKASDHLIIWFWKVIGGMTTDQQRALLFFWTSVKFLPAEGFSGLDSKLCIYQSALSIDHLPTSHTCFYRIYLPPYTSLSMTRKRLLLLTQEHLGYGFGVL